MSLAALRLAPGIQANAEIHLGTRSVPEYLFSPLQTVDDATRAR